MRILRTRPTLHFVYLLVRCRCGRRFGLRAGRQLVCYHCGRIAGPTAAGPVRPRAVRKERVSSRAAGGGVAARARWRPDNRGSE